ncbi:MAG: hypothetical protein WC668_03740 [Patescibacteria group bacterium]|jgi:H/ACA ribonucleoprotein complex subunit 3
MNVTIDGKRFRLNPQNAIGKGGEADVYSIGGGEALKIFKGPDHPDLSGFPELQRQARDRIATHQAKLPNFPSGLPAAVVKPLSLATDAKDQIIGYKMPLISGAEVLFRYADTDWRQTGGIKDNDVLSIFADLHPTVDGIHRVAIISDFNDLNVLIQGKKAFIIDADSMSFGRWLSPMFTARFVDPLLCDPQKTSPQLIKPHNENSDWYAFCIMLMQVLLFAGPYDGVYRPKDSAKRLPHDQRPLKRITVFNPEVRYPKNARPYNTLPDELLHHFSMVFEKDQRGSFPLRLITDARFTTCTACGYTHMRNICPHCQHTAPAAVITKMTVKGQVTATQIFRTSGTIVCSSVFNKRLFYLYHEAGKFRREDGSKIIEAPLDAQTRYRLSPELTLFGKGGIIRTFKNGLEQEILGVDCFNGTLPVFDVTENGRYWTYGGELWRDGQYAPELIGQTLKNQTLIWAGKKFGFGFYRAAQGLVHFTFDAKQPAINDSISLPKLPGQLLDTTCVFGDDFCWFFTAVQMAGKIINTASLINSNGDVLAHQEEEANVSSWLSSIRGKFPIGPVLLAATDEGIVQVKESGGRIQATKTFPDTEPFVNSKIKLFGLADGLYAIGRNTITKLVIK